MVFTDYIKSLPNQQIETIKKLAEITCSTPAAVYKWVNGENPPTPIKQKVIAEYLGMSVEELFPNNKKELIMKKLFIQGGQGSGKTNAVRKITEGKKTIVFTPSEQIATIINKMQEEQYEYIVFEEANGFDEEFLYKVLNLPISDQTTAIVVSQNVLKLW